MRALFLVLLIAGMAFCHGPCEKKSGVWFCVSKENSHTQYSRSSWIHWIDEDKDKINTRNEVLSAESIIPVTYDSTGTKVIAGKWVCFYTGNVYTNPRKLDIDHFIPLKEAHVSGADSWSRDKKRLYANDMFLSGNTLIAVSLSANRSKSYRDPSEWMPAKNKCTYVKLWVDLKSTWDLSMDQKEAKFIEKYLNYCKI